jgi:uracil-DNA glycosylase family 4
LLCIGEAPGDSEDTLGKPFCGPAGHLQDTIINNATGVKDWTLTKGLAGDLVRGKVRVGMTNVIGCIPTLKEDDNGRIQKAKDFDDWEYAVAPCNPRLVEIIKLAKPQAVLLIGSVACEHGKLTLRNMDLDIPTLEQTHPAAMVRAAVDVQDILIRRAECNLEDFVDKNIRGMGDVPW